MPKNTYSREEYDLMKRFFNMGFMPPSEWETYRTKYKKYNKYHNQVKKGEADEKI